MTDRPVGFYIKKINDEFYKEMNRDLKAYDLTASQMQFLIVLYLHQQAMTIKELQNHLHVAQPTVTGIAARLADKKMITIAVAPEDHRQKIVFETNKSLKLLHQLYLTSQRAERRLLRALTSDEQIELKTLLQKVFNSIK